MECLLDCWLLWHDVTIVRPMGQVGGGLYLQTMSHSDIGICIGTKRREREKQITKTWLNLLCNGLLPIRWSRVVYFATDDNSDSFWIFLLLNPRRCEMDGVRRARKRARDGQEKRNKLTKDKPSQPNDFRPTTLTFLIIKAWKKVA